jgi:hypothetical protein
MKSISITTYRGFSKVKGKCSLQELIGWVRSRQYANLIEKIGRLVSEGKTKEAENVKRQAHWPGAPPGHRYRTGPGCPAPYAVSPAAPCASPRTGWRTA